MRLLTAKTSNARADYGRSDTGLLMNGVDVVGISHPPFITTAPYLIGELAPPDNIISDWNREVAGSDETGPKAIPLAWREINYEERYRDFLESDFKAEKGLEQIIERLEDKNVCLVCGCNLYPYCPRRIIREYIEEADLD